MLSMTKRTPSSVKHRGGDVVLRGWFLGLLDDFITVHGAKTCTQNIDKATEERPSQTSVQSENLWSELKL